MILRRRRQLRLMMVRMREHGGMEMQKLLLVWQL
jgi:hypothetical protein